MSDRPVACPRCGAWFDVGTRRLVQCPSCPATWRVAAVNGRRRLENTNPPTAIAEDVLDAMEMRLVAQAMGSKKLVRKSSAK